MWIDDDTLANLPDTAPTRGRPRLYSDALIQALLGLKTVFHLPLRALQGFAQSLRDLAFADLPVPNYTTVCRRTQTLLVKPPVMRSSERLHLVIDSTGVKVYGEGEWKVRRYGYSKRRTWRKVHLALDANTGQLRAALMTHQDVADGEVLPELLDQIPAGDPIDTIGGDGAYDTQACYAAITARGAAPSVPPREGAAHWPPPRPAGLSAMRQSMRSNKVAGANGSNKAAITVVRWPRTRCTDSRRSRVHACGHAAPTRKRPRLPFAWACSIGWRNSHVRNPSVSSEFANKGTTSSSRLISTTTPPGPGGGLS